MSNLTVRVLFALIAAPFFLFMLYFNFETRWAALSFLLVGGAWEYFKISKKELETGLFEFAGPLFVAINCVLWGYLQMEKWAFGLLPIYVLVYIFIIFHREPIKTLYRGLAIQLFGLFFFAYWLLPIFKTINDAPGFSGVLKFLFIIFVMWISDSGAYFCGRFFGKNKFAPQISPKKTWEGSIGGAILVMIFAYLVGEKLLELPVSIVLIFSIALAISSQVGDLLFSSFKRYFDVKDSSRIFPGHGGILDRFDSLFLAAPTIGIWLYLV